jgi:hypothetical protein
MGGAQSRRSRPMVGGGEEKIARDPNAKNLSYRKPEVLSAERFPQVPEASGVVGLPDRRWMSSNELAISFL